MEQWRNQHRHERNAVWLVTHDVLNAIEAHLVMVAKVRVYKHLEKVVDRQAGVLVFFAQLKLVDLDQKLVGRLRGPSWNEDILLLGLAFA